MVVDLMRFHAYAATEVDAPNLSERQQLPADAATCYEDVRTGLCVMLCICICLKNVQVKPEHVNPFEEFARSRANLLAAQKAGQKAVRWCTVYACMYMCDHI